MTRSPRLLVWLVVALATTSCTAGSDSSDPAVAPEATPTNTASASTPGAPSDSASRAEVNLPEASAALTPGDGIEVIGSVPNPLPSGERWVLVNTTLDGQIIAGVEVGEESIRPATIDPVTGATTWLGDSSEGVVFAADSDERRIVWVESTAQDLFTFPWVIHSYDRRTGQTMTVAQAPDVGVNPIPAAPDGTTPSILGDRVWFAAVDRMEGRRAVPAVFSASLESPAPLRREVKNAFNPKVGGDAVVYLRADTGTFRNWQIRERDPRTGTDALVAEGGPKSRFSGIAATRGALMWQASERGRCVVTVRTAKETRDLTSKGCDSAFAYYPHATTRYVTYSNMPPAGRGYKAYVYDIQERTLRQLTEELMVRSPSGAGEYLAWSPVTGGNAGTVMVARLTAAD